jgi:hypothetical protein
VTAQLRAGGSTSVPPVSPIAPRPAAEPGVIGTSILLLNRIGFEDRLVPSSVWITTLPAGTVTVTIVRPGGNSVGLPLIGRPAIPR